MRYDLRILYKPCQNVFSKIKLQMLQGKEKAAINSNLKNYYIFLLI